MQCILNWVVEHDILFGQFQQHGVVKELVDGDIFTEALWGGEGRGGKGRGEEEKGGGRQEEREGREGEGRGREGRRGEEKGEEDEREGGEGATKLGSWTNRVWLVTKCKEGLSGVGSTKVVTCPECACLTHYQTHSNTA